MSILRMSKRAVKQRSERRRYGHSETARQTLRSQLFNNENTKIFTGCFDEWMDAELRSVFVDFSEGSLQVFDITHCA